MEVMEKKKKGGEGQIDAGPDSSSDANGRTLRIEEISTKWSDCKIDGFDIRSQRH